VKDNVSTGIRDAPGDNFLSDTLGAVQTLAELFAWRVRHSPDTNDYLQFESALVAWTPALLQQMALHIERTAQAMQSPLLRRGERVTILLPTALDAVSVDSKVDFASLATVVGPMLFIFHLPKSNILMPVLSN
jgi:long-chain acyl-CoA synthetase